MFMSSRELTTSSYGVIYLKSQYLKNTEFNELIADLSRDGKLTRREYWKIIKLEKELEKRKVLNEIVNIR